MTTYQNPLVVGVFQQEMEAKEALEDLYQAGFEQNQLGFARQKNGQVTTDLRKEMTQLGMPQEQAGYYDHEYRAGHPVVSVRADGREQEAVQILSNHGAQGVENPNSETDAGRPTTNNTYDEAADQTKYYDNTNDAR